ncbi:MAG: glycosyltransferase family 2 protein [Simkaniaceae bacterium]|nr:glycosyltransferase family 2 protein [Simkaniaceae bacterium]
MKRHHLQVIVALIVTLMLPLFFLKRYAMFKSKKHRSVATAQIDSSYGHTISEKTFVVIVPVTHETTDLKHQMQSILSQQYGHYRTYYLVNPETANTLEDLLEREGERARCSVEVIGQSESMIERYSKIIQRCADDEIIVHMSSNDWFAADNVLDLLNHIYCTEDIWLTYGQYLDQLTNRKGLAHNRAAKSWSVKRSQQTNWMQAPFKTFYASVFKLLSPEEIERLKDKSFDETFHHLLKPMAQLSRKHIRFVPDVLSIHN